MKRFLAVTLAASAIALGLAACDSGYYGHDYYGHGYGDPCQQFTSCGTCTPVMGCGWCTTANGSACLSDPDECAGAQQFSWTWEPSGCTYAPDASVTPIDGGGPVPDAGVPDTSRPPTDAASLADTARPEPDASDAAPE